MVEKFVFPPLVLFRHLLSATQKQQRGSGTAESLLEQWFACCCAVPEPSAAVSGARRGASLCYSMVCYLWSSYAGIVRSAPLEGQSVVYPVAMQAPVMTRTHTTQHAHTQPGTYVRTQTRAQTGPPHTQTGEKVS